MSRLVERDGQLSHLAELLSQSRSGSGHVALLEGAAATGRTELLHTFRRSADDVLRLQAVCSPAERDLPLGMVGQLLVRPGLPADLRARVTAVIGAPDAGSAQVLNALCLELLDLADRSPVLITIDDAHHADPASLQWLPYLVRRIGAAPVLVVLASDPDRLPIRPELVRHPHCDVVRLDRLSQAGVAELVTNELGESAAYCLSTAMHAASGGSPLLLKALIDDWRDDHEMAGRRYRQTLLDGFRRGGPDTLGVVRGLAVIGEKALLDRLIGLDSTTDILRSLNASGLLVDDGFGHANGRQAVLDDLPPHERAELHRTAARLLYDRGEPAVAVAPHLVAGGGADGVPLTEVLLDAAEGHLLDNCMAAAVECLENAITCSPPGRSTGPIRARLALVEWRADPVAAARHLTSLIADACAGLLSMSDCLEVSRQLLWQARIDEAAALVDQLWANAAEHSDEALAELQAFELWLACTYPRLARRTHQRVPRPATSSGGLVLAGVLKHGRGDDLAEQLLQRADVRRDAFWTTESPLVYLMSQVYAGRTGSAARWCERWTQDPRTRDVPVLRAQLAAVAGEIAARNGDFATALVEATNSLTHLAPHLWGTAVGFPLGGAVLAATRTGDLGAAVEHLRQPVPLAMFDSRYGLHYLHARGHYHLACDNSHAALADFHACGELMRSWSLDTPGLVPWRTSAAEALLRQGNRDQARRLLNDQLARIGTDLGANRGRALRLLAACCSEQKRIDLLGDAVEIIESSGDRYELARVLADLSKAQQAVGEQRRARLTARRAWHVARSCQAEPVCQELFPDGDCDAAEDDAITALSRAERRVAVLASAGYTNRAIAGKLFITESTVEQHLTQVYRKLNVKHREDLPAMPLPASA